MRAKTLLLITFLILTLFAVTGLPPPSHRVIFLSMMLSGLGHVYAVSGKKSEAQAVIDELKRKSQKEYEPADGIALIYAGLGDKDQAFTWLEKAYQERAFKMSWLKVEPRWDGMRSDQRFADLVRRVGL